MFSSNYGGFGAKSDSGSNNLQEYLTAVPSKNLVDKNAFSETTYYNGTTFLIQSNSASSLKRTDYIKVEQGETYFRSPDGSGSFVGYFDINKNPLSLNATQLAGVNGSYFTVPENLGVEYIVANLPKTGFDDTYQIEKGDVFTSYEAFGDVYKLNHLELDIPSASLENYKNSFGPTFKLNMITLGSVVTSPAVAPHANGTKAYILSTRNLGTGSGTTRATDFIEVKEGRTYTVQNTGFTTQLTGGYFNVSKVSIFEPIVGSLIPGFTAHNFTVPRGFGIKYVVFNYAYADATVPGKIMISEGYLVKTYEPYISIDRLLDEVIPSSVKKIESDNGIEKIRLNTIKYPGIYAKFPVLAENCRKRKQDVTMAFWGTSMLARTMDADLEPIAIGSTSPPLADGYNLFNYIVNQLMWEGQYYRRYDATGFFTQSGTFTESYTDASWDDKACREGRTRFSTTSGAYVQCIVPVNAWQFNLIFRSEAAGDPSCVVTIAEGNNQMEAYDNGTASWVEANGYVLSMVESIATATKGNTTFQKRLKMRCKSGLIDSRATTKTLRITKSSDTSKRLLYWGVEWSIRQHMITFINAARGGHNFSLTSLGLQKYMDNELFSFNPTCYFVEPTINNNGASVFSNITTRSRQYYVDLMDYWLFDLGNADSLFSRTSSLSGAELILMNTTPSCENGNINTTTKEWNFATEHTTGEMVCVNDYFYYHGDWLNTLPYAVVDIHSHFMRQALLDFGNFYDAFKGCGASGNTYSQDGTHWSNIGVRLAAEITLGIFDFI